MKPRHGPDHISRMIRHTTRMHQKQMHRLVQGYDVYPGQPPLMFVLARQPGRSQSELAQELEIKAATLTVMLNRMERNGLVRRESDARDQRVSRIFLTSKGETAVNKLRETLDLLEEESMRGLSEEERELLKSMLMRISRNLAAMDDSDPSGGGSNVRRDR